ncbi:MAG: zf-HC2 domain-containing protein [Acidobacteria bacterium]|nr:zf-HC2 domain-containing protein [Acidobacteriota bacterium]
MTQLECKEIFAMLSQYLDRELPGDVCDQIWQHINGCPPCVEFVKSLEKTVALCREVPFSERPTPLGEDALERLKAAFQK